MALAASVLCGAQKRIIAKAHNTVCRRNPAAPFRGCLDKEEFKALRFTLVECIMECIAAWDAPLPTDPARFRAQPNRNHSRRLYSQTYPGIWPSRPAGALQTLPYLAFDIFCQLRYWAGPRCCRILRRLTGGWGPRVARTDIGFSPVLKIEHASLTRQVYPGPSARFADGSSKEGLHLMNYRNVSAPARPVSRTLAAIARNFAQSVALAGALAIATGTMASAQQQPAAPAAKPAPAKKPPAKPAPAAPAPAPEAQQPAPLFPNLPRHLAFETGRCFADASVLGL